MIDFHSRGKTTSTLNPSMFLSRFSSERTPFREPTSGFIRRKTSADVKKVDTPDSNQLGSCVRVVPETGTANMSRSQSYRAFGIWGYECIRTIAYTESCIDLIVFS